MSLPGWLEPLLPGETGIAWEQVAPLLPPEAYLAGGTAIAVHLRHRQSRDLDFYFHEPIDLDELLLRLRSRVPFAVTQQAPGTLNGLFGTTRVQLLQVGLERPERRLEPTTLVAGLHVAGLGDLLAMKLNAIAGRAQLRDYYDLMAIEQQANRSVEEGLSLFLARYQPVHAESAITPIVLKLGYLDDVADDPFLPIERDTIARYWQKRQPAIVAAIERYGTTAPTPLDLRSLTDPEPPSSPPQRERGNSHDLER
ncbi:MAG: nucleotidyl transferase AbiEii/AbiGii toxin family protein [Thermoleophilia bacterium]|nr:nucleotidyl transferase AbiEii/AbiGii toxin family protein [Thermoleophilia bacterium]